ncbi:MAG: isoprenyl transferase [Marinifilaceae bacterium]|jgi:undecaprenyl diphosphate synthase|nr:isoprenyl transferase [Marinifilaceae bacterium]
MSVNYQLEKSKLPKHVAIIMDGNGRWAKKHGKDRIFGHHHGVDAVRSSLELCGELGIKYLTLYAFSTENWGRPKDEVLGLMSLLVHAIDNETTNLIKNNVKLNTIGNNNDLPEDVQMKLQESIDRTAHCTGVTLSLALSYSSQIEITEACKKIAASVLASDINVDDINPETISANLFTSEIPNPDLMIRTSGEQRISNFLLWQLAYAELYFTDVHWPDFDKDEFCKALEVYTNRERRYGKTSEQVKQ